MTERRATAAAAGLAALVTALPFARGVLAGSALYFRDLARQFFPLRALAVEGLRSRAVWWWNPYAHEGEPLAPPALGYPLDLLQVLWPDERGFSVLLLLHVVLAALTCFALARGLGLSRTAAAAAGIGYALGGFALSSVNLYVYVQALAWAPLVILGLLRAAAGRPRALAGGAAAVAVCLSTTGAEVAAQAMVIAAALALLEPGRARAAARLGASVLLGAALAAVPLAVMAGQVPGSARGAGFPTDVVLGHSVHPLTFLQVLVAGLYGDPARLVERWWGQNFFPRGFPYVLSLYIGAPALAAALVGAARGGRRARMLLALALVAGLVCLGRWAGLEPLVDHLPALRRFRFPVKAFFTVHAAAALLLGLGVDQLAAGARGAWQLLAAAAAATGAALASAPALPRLAPRAMLWFAGGFFPPDMAWPARADRLGFVLRDAAAGGMVALCAAGLAVLVLRERVRPRAGAALVSALVAADLIRAGAGLNPMVPLDVLRPSPEVQQLAAGLRNGGRRLFTCDVERSAGYYQGRALRGERHEVWSTWTLLDTLSPDFNVRLQVPSAYGPDVTMLVPLPRILGAGEGCASFAGLVGRLRAAAVSRVVSVDPLTSPDLTVEHVLRIPRLAPLSVYVYALAGALPAREAPGGRIVEARELPGRIEVTVEATRPTELIVREAYAKGWRATVAGREVPVRLGEGGHMAVDVPSGTSEAVLSYRPPGLAAAAGLSLAALAVISALLLASVWTRRRPRVT